MLDRRYFVRRGALWLLGAAVVGPGVLERLNWRRQSFPTGIDLRPRTERAYLYGGPRHGKSVQLSVDAQGNALTRELHIPRARDSAVQVVGAGDKLSFKLILPNFDLDVYRLLPIRVDGRLEMQYVLPHKWRDY